MYHNGPMYEWSFRDELALDVINVPRAALHFARSLAYPDLNVAGYMYALHELSEEGAEAIDPKGDIEIQMPQLTEFLFHTAGFRGDASNYSDPRHNFLNEVIDRRVGIPISLTILFVEIANRLGIPAFGIGLPGHFIAGVRYPAGIMMLDPYHGGRPLGLDDCRQLVNLATGYEGPMHASWFAPASPREILARMLNNLRASYVSQADWSSSLKVIRLLRQIQPDLPEHLRDLGLVYYHQGNISQAAHYLDTYLRLAPDAVDAQVIRNGIQGILDEWVPMN
jgi:regulator of sirC expression with transglutaminase-like and TPR domain